MAACSVVVSTGLGCTADFEQLVRVGSGACVAGQVCCVSGLWTQKWRVGVSACSVHRLGHGAVLLFKRLALMDNDSRVRI